MLIIVSYCMYKQREFANTRNYYTGAAHLLLLPSLLLISITTGYAASFVPTRKRSRHLQHLHNTSSPPPAIPDTPFLLAITPSSSSALALALCVLLARLLVVPQLCFSLYAYRHSHTAGTLTVRPSSFLACVALRGGGGRVMEAGKGEGG
jgi:hypothetical protein